MTQTKQLITALFTLGILLVKRLTDGLQPARDFLGLLSDLLADDRARADLEIGFEDADLIGTEIRKAKVSDWLDLISHGIEEIKRFAAVFNADEPAEPEPPAEPA